MFEHDETPVPTPTRDPRGHKGTFGRVAAIGGQRSDDATMVGAPALCALGALRAGAGLCTVCAPAGVLEHALTIATGATGVTLPDADIGATVDALARDADCLVVGPGLGVSDRTRAVVVRALGQEECAVVLDADGLNALATLPGAHRDVRAPVVATPHPGEFARLASSVGMDGAGADATGAAELSRRLGVVVVLKSSTTVVTDGFRAWSHDAPNPVLGTGGTGDVLAGAIGGLIAQHHRMPMIAGERTVTSERMGGGSLYDLARLGVEMHARAAKLWRERHDGADAGMTPGELSALLVDARAG
ncbi:MAG: NAD(P)H-hydrate dehydratase [Planctomycetota bacterium]